MLLLTLVGSQAQPPAIPEERHRSVHQRVDYGHCPGIVVGLRNVSGATYFSYGRPDLGDGLAVDENTIFGVGSITTVFTATLLADMAARGELELTNTIWDNSIIDAVAETHHWRFYRACER
jgi:CubicO group peptidase (beta-lactamase class C family)